MELHDHSDDTGPHDESLFTFSVTGNEERHKFLFDNTIQGVVFQNSTGEIVYANKAAERILGLSLDQLRGVKSIDPRWHSIHEDGSPFPGETHPAMESLKTGLPVKDRVMGVFNPSRNRYNWININSFPRFMNGESIPYEVVATFEDITHVRSKTIELNQAILQADVHNANITAIIENTSENIWAINHLYQITYINGVFRNEFLHGFGVELLPGMNIIDALPQPLRQVWKQRYDLALRNQRHTFEEGVAVGPGMVYVQVSMNPILVDGKVIGVSCFARNITDQKNVEKELIKAKEKAEESDRLKSAFLANMSHEIRTPMNSILGFAELLKVPGLSGDSQQEYLQIIEKSGTRMLNIINDIVDISKIEAGLMEVRFANSNLNEQVEYVFRLLMPEAKQKDIEMVIHTPLPTNEAVAWTDREKLYAVLSNLVKNAIKYTPKGSVEFGYELRDLSNGRPGYVEFYVSDTGIGIAPNRQEAIFDRFVQADIEDRHAMQGAGLGLAISKSYVEMLGGKIWVESAVDVGSIFRFTIPYLPPRYGKLSHFEEYSGPSVAELPLLNVLLVEDETDSARLLEVAMTPITKQLHKVKTGYEALDVCRQNPHIDLVLMDIKLPGMNGYEAARLIRAQNPKVVIIAQTAYALAGDRETALLHGCNDYIAKPIHFKELQSLIKKHFSCQ